MPKLSTIAVSVFFAFASVGCASSSRQQAASQPEQPAAAPAAKRGVSAQGLYQLGRFLEGQARYEDAIAAYRDSLRRDPLSVDAYTGLGTALAALGRHEQAIREFQAAAILAPQAAYVHNNLGYAYLLSGANEQAVKALEQATRLDPRHARARENLRVAQAALAAAPVAAARQEKAVEAAKPAVASDGPSFVEISPQVFELKAASRPEPQVMPLSPLPAVESAPLRSVKLEVSNGNGATGLAKRTAALLAGATVRIARLTNQQPYGQAKTEIQYREGYAAEAAGLAESLERPARLVQRSDLAPGVDLRLVLGNDLPSQAAVVRSSRRSRA